MYFSTTLQLRNLVLAATLIFLLTHPASSQITTLMPSASDNATDGVPTDGVFESLGFPNQIRIEVFRSSLSGFGRGLMEFELPNLPAGMGIVSAELHLPVFITTGFPILIDIFGYPSDGIIEASDATRPATLVDTLSFPFDTLTIDPRDLDVTALVAQAAASSTHIGFRGQLDQETTLSPTIVLSLGGREGFGGAEPELRIVVPEPKLGSLLTIGALAFAFSARMALRARKSA